jgi:Putative zinc-finger
MTCEELAQLIPDLVDGTLSGAVLAEAEAALLECPDCRRELEIARQVRAMLIELQAQNVNLQVPAGFEARLLARLRTQNSGLELLDLSSKAFALWLLELINLLGSLISLSLVPQGSRPTTSPQSAGS